MKKILIVQTAFLGDVILATPIIEQLHAKWPTAKIDFLLRKGNESLLEAHPFLNEVIVRDKSEGKWKSLWKTLMRVRREKYDLVVNVHRFLSSGIIAGFSGGGHVCGFDKNPLSFLYSRTEKHVIAGEREAATHEVDRNVSLVACLTGNYTAPMRLYPSPADFDAVQCEEAYICIAPTSVWFSKQWPAEKWLELMGRIPGEFRIFMLGAPGDREMCEDIAGRSDHSKVTVRAGELTLLQSAALMAGAAMNYVNDSAPLHLASAMDAPVTAVFLSTVPRFGFGPRSKESYVMETQEMLDCRPCGLHGFKKCPQGHFKCSEISVDDFPVPVRNGADEE